VTLGDADSKSSLRRGRAEVKLDGSQVKTFVSSSKTTLELVRESDDVLGGK
jgi:hypothetical protein